MNDLILCKHNYVRSLNFIEKEVKKRHLNCTAILIAFVEKKKEARRANAIAKIRRLEIEQQKRLALAEGKRKQKLVEIERRKLEKLKVEKQKALRIKEQQLELYKKQLEHLKNREQGKALLYLGASLLGYTKTERSSQTYTINGRTYDCSTIGSSTHCN